jgi:glycerophosphoryl diester phosphodiesterase
MRPRIKTDFFSLPKPRAIAHRGSAATCPENTLASFQAAYEIGARYFELDVHMTRDGAVVVSHDEDLARTCGRPSLIKQLNLAELEAYDPGHGFAAPDGSFPFRGKGLAVPTLARVLEQFSEVRFIVEVKQTEPSLVRPLLAVIDAAEMRRRVLIASEYQAPLDEVRATAPDIPTNLSAREVGLFVQALPVRMEGYQPPGDAIQIPVDYESFRLVTPESVAAAHQLGMEMHVWTVNDENEMRELLALGVDGLLSDYPARLLEVIAER